jgi:pimeloyl-ACP methyl ester carboxylesterase
MAALNRPDRIERLVIVNAPHPFIFQRSLFDDADQRAASQYITAFRNPEFEQFVERIGLSQFFDTSFANHASPEEIAAEKPVYLDQWAQEGTLTAMLNWYRASQIVVPAPGETPTRPAYLDAPFPPTRMPVLVIWGLKDTALRPVQLDGLDAVVPDLTIERIDAGHFVPWQNPQAVVAAIRKWEGR